MDLEKIKEGMIFKNYIDLCNSLEIKSKKGRSRTLHIEDLKRYFEFETEGHKIIITHVYNVPLLKENKNAVYSKLIQKLILDGLIKHYNKTGTKRIILTNSTMMKEFSMINDNYFKYKDNHDKLSETLNINKMQIKDFYASTYTKLKSTLVTALNGLKKNTVIKYQEVEMISILYDNNYINRKMTDKEKELHLQIQGRYLLDHNTTEQSVFLKGGWNKYVNWINKEMSKELKVNVTMVYKSYEIIFNDLIQRESQNIDNYLIKHIDKIKDELNSEIVDRFKDSYHKRYNKYNELYNDDDYIWMMSNDIDKMILRLSKDDGCKLIDYTIKR